MTVEDQPATRRVKTIVASELERIGQWDHEYGQDWWQLSREEARIFGLELDDMAELVIVWQAYEEINKITSQIGIASYLIEQMKAEHPWMCSMEDNTTDENEFVRFAKIFGVSNRKAHAWFNKNKFWAVRACLITYKDELTADQDHNITY